MTICDFFFFFFSFYRRMIGFKGSISTGVLGLMRDDTTKIIKEERQV